MAVLGIYRVYYPQKTFWIEKFSNVINNHSPRKNVREGRKVCTWIPGNLFRSRG